VKKEIDLLHGPIFKTLGKLAVPIMLSGAFQTAYNLTDMLWLGRLSASSVLAAGLAGMFLWFSSSVCGIVRSGTQVLTGQNIGAGKKKKSYEISSEGLRISLLLGTLCLLAGILLAYPYISFFNVESNETIKEAVLYLRITALALPFNFLAITISGIFSALGDSRTVFKINAVSCLINIIFDPVLIFVFKMGIAGAALATSLAQFSGFILALIYSLKNDFFKNLSFKLRTDNLTRKKIFQIGIPSGLSNMLYALISMVISRQIASFGDNAVAAQKLGLQIESVVYMMADGFGSACNIFTAQNFGAGNKKRIKEGIKASLIIALIWGSICTVLLLVFPEEIFSFFIEDSEVIPYGAGYLRIMAYSEILNCIEITCIGAFAGLGHTLPPSLISIIFTAIRIPLISVLSPVFGSDGAWLACSISSSIKGILAYSVLYLRLNTYLEK